MVIMIMWKLFAPFALVRLGKLASHAVVGTRYRSLGKKRAAGNYFCDLTDGNVIFFFKLMLE